MSSQPMLPGMAVRATRGMMLADLENTFSAWNERGWYTGTAGRAMRGSLRVAAKAIDRLAAEVGKESQCASRALELHDRIVSAEDRMTARSNDADEFDQLIRGLTDS